MKIIIKPEFGDTINLRDSRLTKVFNKGVIEYILNTDVDTLSEVTKMFSNNDLKNSMNVLYNHIEKSEDVELKNLYNNIVDRL